MAAAEQLPALATRPPPPSRSPPTTRDVAWVVEWPDDRGLAKVKKADSTLLENRFLQHSGVLHDVPLLLAPNDPEEDGGFYSLRPRMYALVRRGDVLLQVETQTASTRLIHRADCRPPAVTPLLDHAHTLATAAATAQAVAGGDSVNGSIDGEAVHELDGSGGAMCGGAALALAVDGRVVLTPATRTTLMRRMLSHASIPASTTTVDLDALDGAVTLQWESIAQRLRTLAPTAAAAPTTVDGLCALQLLRLTMEHGLPLQKDLPAQQREYKLCLRYCVQWIGEADLSVDAVHTSADGAAHNLLEAFGACQQQQVSAIMQTFAALTGASASFEQQVLHLVEAEKQRTLNNMATLLEPWYACFDLPSLQAPHLLSALTLVLHDDFGFGSISLAQLDHACNTAWSAEEINVLRAYFAATFRPEAVVHAILSDINKSGEFEDFATEGHVPIAAPMEFVSEEIARMTAAGATQEERDVFSESLMYSPDAVYTKAPPAARIENEYDFVFLSPAAAASLVLRALP